MKRKTSINLESEKIHIPTDKYSSSVISRNKKVKSLISKMKAANTKIEAIREKLSIPISEEEKKLLLEFAPQYFAEFLECLAELLPLLPPKKAEEVSKVVLQIMKEMGIPPPNFY